MEFFGPIGQGIAPGLKREDLDGSYAHSALMQHLDVAADLRIDVALITRLLANSGRKDALAAQLDTLEHQGYVKRDGKALTAHVALAGGKVTVNGRPYPPAGVTRAPVRGSKTGGPRYRLTAARPGHISQNKAGAEYVASGLIRLLGIFVPVIKLPQQTLDETARKRREWRAVRRSTKQMIGAALSRPLVVMTLGNN